MTESDNPAHPTKVLHANAQGEYNQFSTIAPDLGAMERPPRPGTTAYRGLLARYDAEVDGECTCGAGVVRLNREQRRQLQSNPPPSFLQCWHDTGCPAVSAAVDLYLSNRFASRR